MTARPEAHEGEAQERFERHARLRKFLGHTSAWRHKFVHGPIGPMPSEAEALERAARAQREWPVRLAEFDEFGRASPSSPWKDDFAFEFAMLLDPSWERAATTAILKEIVAVDPGSTGARRAIVASRHQ